MADEAGQAQSGQSSSGGSQQTSAGSASQQGTGSQATQTITQSGQSQQAEQQSATQQQSAAPSRPAYVPDTFWDATGNKIKDKEFGEHFNALTARVAADDVAKLSRPQNPDAYKVELPADFKPPEGVQFKFRDGDPLLVQARTMAHEMGISQEHFSKLLGLYAGAQVADQQQITAARNAEIGKLGATGPARVTAVNTWLDAMGAGSLKGRMFTAADVQTFESLITKFTNGGGASFRATGREPPELPGRRSAEEVSKMTPAARLDYNRQFDQSKMPAWKDPRAA